MFLRWLRFIRIQLQAQLKKCGQQKQLGWEQLKTDLDQCEGDDFVDIVAAVTGEKPSHCLVHEQ
jgi:hypothetical protein